MKRIVMLGVVTLGLALASASAAQPSTSAAPTTEAAPAIPPTSPSAPPSHHDSTPWWMYGAGVVLVGCSVWHSIFGKPRWISSHHPYTAAVHPPIDDSRADAGSSDNTKG